MIAQSIYVKSRVLSHKKMLLSDPRVRDLNETQWRFEWESLQNAEKDHHEELKDGLEAIRRLLTGVLGLDLMPREEPETGYLRRPEPDEYTPLSLLVARSEWVKELADRMDALEEQTKLKEEEALGIGGIEELEELEKELLDSGDLVFIDDPDELRKYNAWNSPASKHIREHMILPLEEVPVQDNSEPPLKKGITFNRD